MKMLKSVCVVTMLFLGACATKPPVSQFTKSQGSDLEQAARSGNVAELGKLLDARGSITEADRFNIIYNALMTECHTEIVRLALQKKGDDFDSNLTKPEEGFSDRLSKVGAELCLGDKNKWDPGLPKRPASQLVELASKHFCSDALVMISDKTSPDDFAIGIYKRPSHIDTRVKGATLESFLEVFEKVALRDNEAPEGAQKVIDTTKFASARVKSDCNKVGGESCKANVAFQSTLGKLKSYAESKAHEATPDGILDLACDSYGRMEDYLNRIREENEKAKISGYVNKFSLKSWGDSAYRHKKEYEEYNSQYRSQTKKNINPKKQCEP